MSFPAGAASLDGVLFGRLLFDFSRERFGEDSSRAERPEAEPHAGSGAASAIYRMKSQRSSPIALVNNSRHGVCNVATRPEAETLAATPPTDLPVSGAIDLYFYRLLAFNASVRLGLPLCMPTLQQQQDCPQWCNSRLTRSSPNSKMPSEAVRLPSGWKPCGRSPISSSMTGNASATTRSRSSTTCSAS